MDPVKRAPAAELTIAELAEKPPAEAPSVKGLPPDVSMPVGSAGAEVAYWRGRALKAEEALRRYVNAKRG